MTQLLVIGFSKAIRGKSLKKTPLHTRRMEVRHSGLWAPVEGGVYLKGGGWRGLGLGLGLGLGGLI